MDLLGRVGVGCWTPLAIVFLNGGSVVFWSLIYTHKTVQHYRTRYSCSIRFLMGKRRFQ